MISSMTEANETDIETGTEMCSSRSIKLPTTRGTVEVVATGWESSLCNLPHESGNAVRLEIIAANAWNILLLLLPHQTSPTFFLFLYFFMLTRHASRTEPFKWWLFIEILVNTPRYTHTLYQTPQPLTVNKKTIKRSNIIKIQYENKTIFKLWKTFISYVRFSHTHITHL